MTLFIWLILCICVGCLAGDRGRNPLAWGMISIFISPLLGFIMLMCLGKMN